MKTLLLLLLVALVAVVYGCHTNQECTQTCQHNQEPYCHREGHHGHHGHDVTPGRCDCRHIIINIKRAGHRECSVDPECAGFCTNGTTPECTHNAHHGHNHCVCLCMTNDDCTGTCNHGGNMHCTRHHDHGHHHCTCPVH